MEKIARAIVKKPYIILADEPTGNLDNETGTQIVSLLKELSKECLILIVSHNTIDTYKYADRIIKLANGNIISDETRNLQYLDNVTYQEGVMYYPMDKTLTNDDINILNDKLDNKNIKKVVGVSDKYITTTTNKEERNIKIDKKNLSIKNMFKLCLTFLKSKVFRIAASSFMIAVIMVILALSQTIITFDSGKIIEDELYNKNNDVLLIKQTETNSYYGEEIKFNKVIDEETIQKFKNTKYDGEIYPLINFSVPIIEHSNYLGKYYSLFTYGPYLNSSLGTLQVDEQFFINKIGKFEFVTRLEEFDPRGVFITDYLADVILLLNTQYKGKAREDILGEYTYSRYETNRAYINGIIKTDYKEKYEVFLKKYLNSSKNNISELIQEPVFLELYNDIYSYLGYSYTFNENFIEDNINDSILDIAPSYQVIINDVLKNDHTTGIYVVHENYLNYNLKENEVLMSMTKYNEYFKTNYTKENYKTFVPHKIKISEYLFYDEDLNVPLLEEEVYIKALFSGDSFMHVSDELFDKFSENAFVYSGIYFSGTSGINHIVNLSNDLGMEIQSLTIEAINTMTKAVDVFIPIFELVAIVLCAGIVFIMISFSTKMVKDKMHDIGILKALGCKNNTIGIVFGFQLLLIALLTIILSTIGYFFFIDLANDVLIESLKVLAPSHIVLDLDFLTFKIDIVGINSLLVIILTIISFVIPMLKIYKIKPVKIIKTKE